MAFPWQLPGTQNNGRNPTLLPNFDRPFAKNGVITLTPSSELAGELGTAVPASGSVTVAGTVAAGNVISLVVKSPVFAPSVTIQYTAVSTDTLDTIASALASLINGSSILSSYGYWANADGAAVVVNQRGPVGNFATLSASSTGAETFTVVQPSGGSGAIVPLSNFAWAYNGVVKDYFYGLPYALPYHQLSVMVAQGLPIA